MDSTMSNSSSMGSPMGDSMGSMMMGMQDMEMVFFTADNTPLYSSSWKPNTVGQYAGTCIFLIVLTVMSRILFAWKAVLERRWLSKTRQLNSRVTKVVTDAEEQFIPNHDPTQNRQDGPFGFGVPLRISIDIPRAMLFTVLLGVGYLLMLAVMTMNVGYFLSILGGGFLGELLFGRFVSSTNMEEHMC